MTDASRRTCRFRDHPLGSGHCYLKLGSHRRKDVPRTVQCVGQTTLKRQTQEIGQNRPEWSRDSRGSEEVLTI